jgi:hypothetical protein
MRVDLSFLHATARFRTVARQSPPVAARGAHCCELTHAFVQRSSALNAQCGMLANRCGTRRASTLIPQHRIKDSVMKKFVLTIAAAVAALSAIAPAQAYEHHHRECHKVHVHHHWEKRCH